MLCETWGEVNKQESFARQYSSLISHKSAWELISNEALCSMVQIQLGKNRQALPVLHYFSTMALGGSNISSSSLKKHLIASLL